MTRPAGQPPIWRAVLAACLCGLLAASATGQAGAPAPPRPERLPRVPPTRLGLQVLARAEAVLVVRILKVAPAAADTALVQARVVERMRGDGRDNAVGRDVALFAAAGEFRPGPEELLFLQRYRGGERLLCLLRVSERQAGYQRWLGIARRSLWLCEIEDAAERADATLEQLVAWLSDREDRVRAYALGELRWMAAQQRWFWSDARRARLAEGAAAIEWPDVAVGVESVASMLSSPDSAPSAPPRTGQSPR